ETIMAADHVIDIGYGAGAHGGKIIASCKPRELINSDTLTANYLSGKIQIKPGKIRKGNGNKIELSGCTGNNLKDVNVGFPLGKLICITGVSGSGKSTLINETLYPILNQHFNRSSQKPLPYKKIKGLENIDKVIEIDQSPIGRTPRSNPATYIGVFSDIRNLFAQLNESKVRGYPPGWFSFNVKGGRCETCQGAGMRVIEMNFLPDVNVICENCNGHRYNREILDVRYRGKSINDVLNMSIETAVDFFENMPSIRHKIKTLKEVGLGYITLGQQSTTLSGGEAQRVKLATELAKKDTGNTLYILDEPTTGLHFEDVRILLDVLNILVDKGNSVLVIEHNMDVIKMSDYIIDIGPEGGSKGGQVIATGTPEELIKNEKSITGQYLKQEFDWMKKTFSN
ncbi:MAG: ATP-binding cassette domain-containing protein, partial [Bacteroidota bacterium]